MTRRWAELPLWAWTLFGLLSVALIGLSLSGRISVSIYEAIGFTAGLASVWLMKVGSPFNWPMGVVYAGSYAVLFLRDQLWGDGSLMVVYVVTGFIGWLWWTWRGPGQVAAIRRASIVEIALGFNLGVIGALLMYSTFVRSGNPAPALDAVTTALSLVGQWLLMRRALENWLFWLVADAIYVPLYISRGFHVTAVLYALYFVLAVMGWREWSRTLGAAPAPSEII